MEPDNAEDSGAESSRPLHGKRSARGWIEFRRRLLGSAAEGKSDEPDVRPESEEAFSDKMLDAMEEITALRTGKVQPDDVDPQAVARWIQLFGLETLRMMLALPDAPENTTDAASHPTNPATTSQPLPDAPENTSNSE
jgi:hypothetical protein